MFLNYSDIPGFPNIYLDYLYEFENVKKYYKTDFRDDETVLKVIQQVSKTKEERDKISEIISKQYETVSPSEKTSNNIALLKENNTVAIVTGQQLGLFLGPLYTIYKIITAIKLSVFYSQKYPEYNFVPVFWMEGDDHDFNEIRSINILDNENNICRITYNDGLDDETNRGSMGDYQLDKNIEEVFNTLNSSLRNTEFKESVLNTLKNYYYPEVTLKKAFFNLLFSLFDKYGLIIFDPQDVEVKKMMRPVFKADLANFKFVSEELIRRSAELEEVYHAQVKIKPINLFYNEDGGRYLIEPTGGEFRLKGKRKKFEFSKLQEELELYPEKFSPNVILRPICQDTVLPVAVYVAGPSEISYFAQIIPYYHILNMNPPVLFPRAGVTIIESKVQNILNKYNLKINDFFYDIEQLSKNITMKFSEFKTEEVFEKSRKEISAILQKLSEDLKLIEPSLFDGVNSINEKIEHYFNLLKEKTNVSLMKKNEIAFRQVFASANILYPESEIQERVINFIYFVNKYGMNFIDFLYERIETHKFEHQIISL